MAKATREELFEAMHAMRARGVKVINRLVREEIGGGSLSDVQPHVKAFLAEFPESRGGGILALAQAAQETGPVVVHPAVQRILDGVSAALVPLAGEVERVRADTAESERAHARSEIAAVQERAAASIRAIQADLEESGATVTDLVTECEELKAAVSRKEAMIDRLGSERNGFAQQAVDLATSLRDAQHGKFAADGEIASLCEQFVAARTEIRNALSEAAGAKGSAEAATADGQRLRQQIDVLVSEAKVAAGQISKLGIAVAVSAERTENLTAQAAKAVAERQASEVLARDAMARAARFEAVAAASKAESVRLQDDAVAARAETTGLRVETAQLKADHTAALAAAEARKTLPPEAKPAIADVAPKSAKRKEAAAH